jgi:hypothetical protein|tara:strand:+ start:719 stop:937 length:219 start_codon:yes stop_codon:yes gene_type:complete
MFSSNTFPPVQTQPAIHTAGHTLLPSAGFKLLQLRRPQPLPQDSKYAPGGHIVGVIMVFFLEVLDYNFHLFF